MLESLPPCRVQKIRMLVATRHPPELKVASVEEFQGQERVSEWVGGWPGAF